jgi:hypothetical protein
MDIGTPGSRLEEGEELWVVMAAQRVRATRAPESLRARIAAMLAVERRAGG